MSNERPVVPAAPSGDGALFRDGIIRQHVPNLDFLDVGALWEARNEKVSVAMLAGAKSASIIDITPAGDEAWIRCRERCALLGVSGYAEYSHDLNDPQIHRKVGVFDFVYCSGVVYHTPSIFQALQRLSSLSTRYLMLGSMVVPEEIETDCGSLKLAGGGMIFVPGLDEATRKILSSYFTGKGLNIMHITQVGPDTQPFMWNPDKPNYGPWWWLFPLQTLCSLVETVGFRIIETHSGWGGLSATIFCEKQFAKPRKDPV